MLNLILLRNCLVQILDGPFKLLVDVEDIASSTSASVRQQVRRARRLMAPP